MSPSKKVDFIMRSDNSTKAGGDSLQIQKYCEELSLHGYDCRVIPFSLNMEIRPAALVHIVNVDRPFDFLHITRQIESNRLFVSPIHHSLEYVRRMRKAERGFGLRSLVGRVTSEGIREWLAFGVRLRRDSDEPLKKLVLAKALLRAMSLIFTVWRQVGAELDRAVAVFILANGEGANLIRDTKCSGNNFVLTPNGIPSDYENIKPVSFFERKTPVIVVGRIEPRKRQLEIARAATSLGVPIQFVGGLTDPSSRYARSFLKLLEASELLSWNGELSHSETLEHISQSKVLLNFSWVEVQSLVDIEAASLGCAVVANQGGNSREWHPEKVTYPVNTDAKSAVALAWSISQQGDPGEGNSTSSYPYTWSATVSRILNEYRRVS